MKSTRKAKNCMAAPLSAGTKEKVTSHCPPEMTDSVKKALNKEIEDFKTNKKHEADAKQDAEASAVGGPSVDAYQDWLANNEGHETVESNPDIVAEDDGIKYHPSKKDNETVSLLKEFRQSLTPRELQVWNLVMRHQYSHREVEKLLNVQRQLVSLYLKRAKAKFTKFAEAIKRAKSVD